MGIIKNLQKFATPKAWTQSLESPLAIPKRRFLNPAETPDGRIATARAERGDGTLSLGGCFSGHTPRGRFQSRFHPSCLRSLMAG
jgi:hypothetical protein